MVALAAAVTVNVDRVNVPVPVVIVLPLTLVGVIAPSVNVIAGVDVGLATLPETPFAVTTLTLVTLPVPRPVAEIVMVFVVLSVVTTMFDAPTRVSCVVAEFAVTVVSPLTAIDEKRFWSPVFVPLIDAAPVTLSVEDDPDSVTPLTEAPVIVGPVARTGAPEP